MILCINKFRKIIKKPLKKTKNSFISHLLHFLLLFTSTRAFTLDHLLYLVKDKRFGHFCFLFDSSIVMYNYRLDECILSNKCLIALEEELLVIYGLSNET